MPSPLNSVKAEAVAVHTSPVAVICALATPVLNPGTTAEMGQHDECRWFAALLLDAQNLPRVARSENADAMPPIAEPLADNAVHVMTDSVEVGLGILHLKRPANYCYPAIRSSSASHRSKAARFSAQNSCWL